MAFPPPGLDHAVAFLSPRLVARVPLSAEYRAHVPVETALLRWLDPRVRSRLPRPVAQAADGSIMVQRRVLGHALDARTWGRLSPSTRRHLIADLADLLCTLHSAPVSRLERLAGRKVTRWVGPTATEHRALPTKVTVVSQRLDTLAPRLLDNSLRDLAADIHAGISSLLLHAAELEPVVIHGDLHEGHMLYHPGQPLGVIDFSDLTAGDPAVDYAHLTGIHPGLPQAVLERTIEASRRRGAPLGPSRGYDPGILDRAWAYRRWDALFLLVDHWYTGRTPEHMARELFAQASQPGRPASDPADLMRETPPSQ